MQNDTAELEALLATEVPALRDRARKAALSRHQDSTAARDATEPMGANVWEHGIAALWASVDHLQGWHLLAQCRPRPVIAHYPLLRAAIDSAVVTRWLFDLTVTAEIRIGRGYRRQLSDLEAQQIMEQADPAVAPTRGPTYAVLIEQFKAEGTAAGVNPASHREGRYSHLAERYGGFPSRHEGSGIFLYSIVSAAAHGHKWGELLTRKVWPPNASEPPIELTRMDADTATWATQKVLYVVQRAVRDAEAYAAG